MQRRLLGLLEVESMSTRRLTTEVARTETFSIWRAMKSMEKRGLVRSDDGHWKLGPP